MIDEKQRRLRFCTRRTMDAKRLRLNIDCFVVGLIFSARIIVSFGPVQEFGKKLV